MPLAAAPLALLAAEVEAEAEPEARVGEVVALGDELLEEPELEAQSGEVLMVTPAPLHRAVAKVMVATLFVSARKIEEGVVFTLKISRRACLNHATASWACSASEVAANACDIEATASVCAFFEAGLLLGCQSRPISSCLWRSQRMLEFHQDSERRQLH